jgi:hypothetical protein
MNTNQMKWIIAIFFMLFIGFSYAAEQKVTLQKNSAAFNEQQEIFDMTVRPGIYKITYPAGGAQNNLLRQKKIINANILRVIKNILREKNLRSDDEFVAYLGVTPTSGKNKIVLHFNQDQRLTYYKFSPALTEVILKKAQ